MPWFFLTFRNGKKHEKEKTRHIPILFLTTLSGRKKFDFKDYESGPIDYLYDPIDPIVLRSKVNIFTELYIQKKLLNKQNALLEQKEQELRKVKIQLEDSNRKLENFSSYDSLTALPNLRRFKELVDLDWRRSIRTGRR